MTDRTHLHPGEIEAQQRFGVAGFWQPDMLDALFRRAISPRQAAHIEALPFFFIATANAAGECDCSFRGREQNASGEPYPLVKVLDEQTLVFPDYPGNKLFNSLGNLIENGHIGMLFIDFESRTRARINGRAEIVEADASYATIWPLAQRYVRVGVEQVYGNCKARIPHMTLLPDVEACGTELRPPSSGASDTGTPAPGRADGDRLGFPRVSGDRAGAAGRR